MKAWLYILLLFPFCLLGQGFELVHNKVLKIPFQYSNNLIFIPVTVNGVPLKFLLDSGISETLIFSLDNENVNFSNTQSTKFYGLGGAVSIEGFEAIENTVVVGKTFKDTHHTIYVILNENFNFSDHIGIPINGIIGFNIFKDHPVKIDYISKNLYIYPNSTSFEKETKKKYKAFPIQIENKKPYVYVHVEQKANPLPSKVLVDLGNSDALWLFEEKMENFTHSSSYVNDFLGRGFNGDVYGERSRIHRLYIGDFILEKPITSNPNSSSIKHIQLVPDRKGSIGNETLRRFSVLLDYPHQKMYLKPNKNFRDPFYMDMSGLDIKHDGMIWDQAIIEVQNPFNATHLQYNLEDKPSTKNTLQYKFTLKPQYSITGCRQDSPAYKAGLRKGDILIRINGRNVNRMTLHAINHILKSEEGKNIVLDIERQGIQQTYTFNLEDPIPYKND